MEIRLNDYEIREVLAEAIAKKLSCAICDIPPEECWFEAKAGVINGDDVDDINDVQFCYKSES